MFESAAARVTVGATRLLTGVQARWLGCAPSEAPRIYFANHTSHLDFVLLCSSLPPRIRRKTRPVAASEYWNQGAVRRYVIRRVFQGVLVKRGFPGKAANPIDPMVQALDRGESLILFPEGTRGAGGGLLPFKCGIFHLAKARPRVELVPVWIENACRVMPKGTVFPIPLLCSVAFGTPVLLEPGESKASFLERLQDAVLNLSHL